ncbi:MAG TPA: hypothetical protein VF784_03220, partial [Anaerolineales bacterium]
FRHGQLSLERKPDPALLALPDPYDPATRHGIPSPQDLSLYKGRFYLYWGPVPALLLVPIKSLIPGVIGDQYLGFAFISGIFLLLSYLIVTIRRLFFPSAPAWTLAPLILAAGLTNPWPWLIATPSIYNAAVTGGQFFFLAGLCVAFAAFRKSPVSVWRLILAGILWAAALGSRISLLLPVAFLSLLILLTLMLERWRLGALQRAVPAVLGLLIPLGAGIAALAWYNWARFGSIFEVGLRYQLAGIYLNAHAAELYSPRYLLQNLYAYLLNPPSLKYPFPYFYPARGPDQSLVPLIVLSPIYYAQEVSGVLLSAPFVLLALVPIAGFLGKRRGTGSASATTPRFTWLVIALAGAFLLMFAFFAAFFWVGERYIGDFMPSLFLLATIGFFQLDTRLAGSLPGSALYRVIWMALVGTSILLGTLIAISFNADGFRQLDPVLWRQLSNLFRP